MIRDKIINNPPMYFIPFIGFAYILLSPHVFSMVEPRGPKFTKNENIDYTHQIPGGNNTEHPNFHNHNYMHIIKSFAHLLHKTISCFVTCVYNELVQIWQEMEFVFKF